MKNNKNNKNNTNKTKNVAPPTKKSNTRLRNFMMRYYFCDNKNPDNVTCKKLAVKAYNISHALETYDPINVNIYSKNFLNWTTKRIS